MHEESSTPLSRLQFWSHARLPVILQSEAAECGLASLAMVAAYYGYKSDINLLRDRFSLSMKGATLFDITQFAEQLELSSRPLKVELENLDELQLPCILHWNMNHFVVLKKVTRKYIEIHDQTHQNEKYITM
jgi:ATP-binding cassette subfamily B protein RaxB